MRVCVVSRKDKFVYHFGILLESGKVLHYASKTNNMFAGDQMVRCDKLDDFTNRREVRILYWTSVSEESSLLDRAEKYWGNGKRYSLWKNNCILFILWCLQVEEKRNFFTVLKYYVKYCIFW